jgi:hypothetical protein
MGGEGGAAHQLRRGVKINCIYLVCLTNRKVTECIDLFRPCQENYSEEIVFEST